MERPWGMLSLFTITSDITLTQAVTHVAYARKSTVRRKWPYAKNKTAQKKSWVREKKNEEKNN